MAVKTEKLSFESTTGEALAARLDLPAREPEATAFFAPCFTCSKDIFAGLRKALLVFHAPRDAIVGIEDAGHIFTAAKHPKSFVSLDDADHLLSRKADAVYVARVLAAWAQRYLNGSEAARPALAAAPGTVVVREAGTGRFALDGDLDEAQRARLLEIADKCPVHKTLKGEAEILTELA